VLEEVQTVGDKQTSACNCRCCCSADIEAGQGMIASGRNIFAAYDCPANSYGVTGKIFGLGAAPCKPCPRNMITDGLTRVNNSDACVNDDGFGYASEGWLSDHTAGTC
jgi:hypothetical protein